MRINKSDLSNYNENDLRDHAEKIGFLSTQLDRLEINSVDIVEKLQKFQVAIPSWALGAGGTRFGRFSFGGEPSSLEQKIDDVGIIHALTQSAGAISLHIPWDIPEDAEAIKQQAASHGIVFDAVNSNTFQDQKNQAHSYKFGSLCNVNKDSRQQAIEHNLEVIKLGNALGSKSMTVWLADGSSFPGQHNFKTAFQNTQDSSHNIKDPLEDLMQSLEAIRIAYAQALLVDRKALEIARAESDVIRCQEILQTAYRTDVRPLLAEARRLSGGVIDPIGFYRKMDIRKNLIMERGMHSISSGL